MNFLLHAELARRDHESSEAALGAMLPDLWRMVARAARAKRDWPLPQDSDPALVRLSNGVAHHFALDSWFHKQSYFSEGERATLLAMGECEAPRIRLFAHATWEMLLDGALTRQLGEAAARALCEHALVHEALANQLAAHHHGSLREAGKVDVASFEQRSARLFGAIRSFALPGGYGHASGVAERLTGMRAAFGFAPPDADELARWLVALGSLEPLADQLLLALLADPSGCALPEARSATKRG